MRVLVRVIAHWCAVVGGEVRQWQDLADMPLTKNATGDAGIIRTMRPLLGDESDEPLTMQKSVVFEKEVQDLESTKGRKQA